jgi:hypothetical protein
MEMKEAIAKKARLKEVTVFFKTFFFETFADGEDGSMMYNGVTGLEKFAANRQEGFEHFLTPPEFDQVFSKDDKKDLIKEVSQKWNDAIAEFRFYPGVIQRLQNHLQNAKKQDKLARKAMLLQLSSYYQDEADVIEALINDLEVKLKTKGY